MRRTPRSPAIQILALSAAGLCGAGAQAQAPGELRFADLGACPLESGEVIRGCRLGFRTFGELDPDGMNAILAPTPFWARRSSWSR